MVTSKLLANLDMYRKVPADLLEGTRRGSALSIISLLVMTTLIVLETKSYFRTRIVTELKLWKSSSNKGHKIRVNFNITMMDLKCDFISMDQVSVFGALQNVNQHLHTRTIDGDGVRRHYYKSASKNQNRKQGDLLLYDPTVSETLEELTKDGEDAVSLSQEKFQKVIQKHRFVFVDFFASWCSHCRDLAPTWEKLAKIMNTASVDIAKKRLQQQHEELEKHLEQDHQVDPWTEEKLHHVEEDFIQLPVLIAKVDCVDHHEFCREQNIVAYPTMQLFVNGEKYGADYHGHRTVLDFTDFLATVEKQYLSTTDLGDLSLAHAIAQQIRRNEIGAYSSMVGGGDDDVEGYYRSEVETGPYYSSSPKRQLYDHKMHNEWIQKDHPGCEISGFLILDRVPGNFYIFAQSDIVDVIPHTNLSHQINFLSFVTAGESASSSPHEDIARKIHPINGQVYINSEFHQAHHHYIKLVSSTTTEGKSTTNTNSYYQILHQSQVALYKSDIVPHAKFQYDFSPIALTYHRVNNRRWYDYLTSLLAIVGGIFTVFGMIDGVLNAIFSSDNRKRLHLNQHYVHANH